jgi:hypothetical protein
MGISRDQSADWQKLADLPEAEFKKRLEDAPGVPATKGVLSASKMIVHVDSLRISGLLCNLEREKYFDKDPQKVAGYMLSTEREDVLRIAPIYIRWLQQLLEALSGVGFEESRCRTFRPQSVLEAHLGESPIQTQNDQP